MKMPTVPVLSLLFFICFETKSLAVRPLLSQQSLTRLATHIVVGEVVMVYQHDGPAELSRTSFLAEILLHAVEKGDSLADQKLVYVRYWKKKRNTSGAVQPGASGHRPIPREGDLIRVYLAKNSRDGFTLENTDGGYNVIGPNGFELLKSSEVDKSD